MKRHWLVTGISSGLGEAIAQILIDSDENYLIGTFRNKSQVHEFNSKYDGKARAFYLDLENENSIHELVSDVISEFGKIDVLVNNAGLGFIGAVEESSLEEVHKVFQINFFGTLQLQFYPI